MVEITWRSDPSQPPLGANPATPEEASFLLHRGNVAFADLDRAGSYVIPVSPEELGLGTPGRATAQNPFAAVLGCADARVPVELVFMQPANELFVVRVAGNVLDGACVGSLDYAINHLPSLRLLSVVGHTGCGAVQAAVDTYLDSSAYLGLSANLPLRTIIDAITPAVRTADIALRESYGHDRSEHAGYREALVLSSVVINSAIAADSVRRIFADHLGDQLNVVYGVYDLPTRLVGLPGPEGQWRQGLIEPPGESGIASFVREVVDCAQVRALIRM